MSLSRSKIFYVIIALIFLLAPPLTNAGELSPEEIARRLQETYEKTVSMSAKFQQTTSVRMSPREKHGNGTLVIQKPGRMRWDYTSPASQVLVSDGTTVSMYFAQSEQMIVSSAMEYLQSDVTYAFFTGKGDLLMDFVPLPADIYNRADEFHLLKLIPRESHPQVQELHLWVSPETFLIQRLRIIDHVESITDLVFSDIKIDVDVPADLFNFQPPAGTEIIRQQ
jgi:outer membrane lipoprotein carrier protein